MAYQSSSNSSSSSSDLPKSEYISVIHDEKRTKTSRSSTDSSDHSSENDYDEDESNKNEITIGIHDRTTIPLAIINDCDILIDELKTNQYKKKLSS